MEILSKWVVLNGLYPNKKDIYILSLQTKLDEKQIKNWFNDYKKKLNFLKTNLLILQVFLKLIY